MTAAKAPQIAPAPWILQGSGYIIFYKFSREFVHHHALLTPQQAACFDGFLGSVMLVDYATSPVGPYRELLFIPGKFRTPYGRRFSITHIAVDSEASTRSGQANWGIPKVTRTFEVEREGRNETFSVLDEHGQPYFRMRLRSGGLGLPLSTALMPLRLAQEWGDHTFLTVPKGWGKGQLAQVEEVWVNPNLFPDICRTRPLLAVRVSDFTMHFPESAIY